MRRILKAYALALPLLLIGSMGPASPGTPASRSPVADGSSAVERSGGTSTWIIQWAAKPPAAFSKESVVVKEYSDSRVTVARPRPGMDEMQWVARWRGTKEARSVEPNQVYRVAAAPNDPLQSHQKYLKQIRAFEAWDKVTANETITVAVVDTGIDLDHPDLAPNLVPGANLLQPELPPEDDNGHGTNVAGVIAAVADNDKGVAGLLWKAKIMPVKALQADGTGEEDKLGEGIRYAVDHGASIVVLSLGLSKPSSYMETVVRYAEEKNVLLVAAAGNEGSAVKYPAAYPTVLAVGGATADNKRSSLSNYGQELDIIAPWNVFTTALDGKYDFGGGTSLAAPQVAAVCAMAWGQRPEMTPAQVRSLIRQTALDTDKRGWDDQTGYGLLQADWALNMPYRDDPFESNDSQASAKALPLGKYTQTSFSGSADADWYKIEAPYSGYLDLTVTASGTSAKVEGQLISLTGNKATSFQAGDSDPVTMRVDKGLSYIRLSLPEASEPTGYGLLPRFRPAADPYEDNERFYMAYTLAPRNHLITGTFDRSGEEDWYRFRADRPGILRVKVSVDTPRIDPTLLIREPGQIGVLIDQAGDGAAETSQKLKVDPGFFEIRVGSIDWSDYPAEGEYTLEIDYETEYPDPYEPNDRSYEAAHMKPGETYSGTLETAEDKDWFTFRLTEPRKVRLEWTSMGPEGKDELNLYDAALRPVETSGSQYSSEDGISGERAVEILLKPGTYYAMLQSPEGSLTLYQLRLSEIPEP